MALSLRSVSLLRTLPVVLLLGVASLSSLALAQEANPPAPEPIKENFDKLELGKLPATMMVVEGGFEIRAEGSGKCLVMLPEPLIEGNVLMGKSVKNGGTIAVKIKASSAKRRHPKIGVSLGGTSGFRFNYVGMEKVLEVVKGDERKTTIDFPTWKAGEWLQLELTATATADGKWQVEGRAWSEKETRPEKPTLSFLSEQALPSGKAGIIGAPYSGTEIFFDDVTITPHAAPKP